MTSIEVEVEVVVVVVVVEAVVVAVLRDASSTHPPSPRLSAPDTGTGYSVGGLGGVIHQRRPLHQPTGSSAGQLAAVRTRDTG